MTTTKPLQAEAPAHRAHVRSPVDVLRIVVGAILLAGGVASANVLDSTLLGLSEDGAAAIESLPDWSHGLPAAALAVAVLAAVVGALAWALATTRFRRFFLLASGFGAAALLSVGVGELIFNLVDDSVRQAFDADATGFSFRPRGKRRPGDPLLAGAMAMLALSGSFLRHSVARRLGATLGVYAALAIWSSGIPALSLVADIGAGVVVASIILLVAGRHDLAPDEREIVVALQSVGLELHEVQPLSVDARGSAPWVGVTTSGDRVFVKALGRDERSADLLFRAYRWIRLRKTGDHRPFESLRRAVEHEALVSLQAAALGIRTPRILGVAEAGTDGMVLAYEAIEGHSADTLDDIDDDALVAIWSMVSRLHHKRIAHRDLRLANIFIDNEGLPWLIDFGFSELAASDQLLGTDVAELLASTTTVVGHERAVAAAHIATGLDELERALPWLQPAALSGATRESVGGNKGLAPIRTMLIEQCGVPAEEPVRLERVNGKTLFIVATIGLSAWFLIPQLADIDDLWIQAKGASTPWAIAAVVLSAFTYAAATASLLGAIPLRIPFWPALMAQVASSFANRVTPAKVGGVATNIRYFQRQGVPTAVSITAVGLNAVAGLIMHVFLTLVFLLLATGDDDASLAILSPATLAAALGVLGVVLFVSIALPVTRRLLILHVVPQLRAGWLSIKAIAQSPTRLLLLFGGSATITLAYLAAMVASLEAFGSTASFPIVAVLFLTASAVANAAPTPGGLGAAEAALIAAFSTVEEVGVVIPAVFLYRLVTFWLPILPGWVALTYLRRTNRI